MIYLFIFGFCIIQLYKARPSKFLEAIKKVIGKIIKLKDIEIICHFLKPISLKATAKSLIILRINFQLIIAQE